jgi:uncharacterized protein (DUF433 family)
MTEITSVVHCDPDLLGGTPVFVGTRVPLQNLIDYLLAGDSFDDFLRSFPTVSHEKATAALDRIGPGEIIHLRAQPPN